MEYRFVFTAKNVNTREESLILHVYPLPVCVAPVAPVMERVSGNVVEFEMSSLTPATHYTVKVYAVRDLAKSAATTTEFTTGEQSYLKFYLFLF